VAEFVFVPNVVNWERQFHGPTGMVADHIRKIALATTAEAKLAAPKKTWQLTFSIVPSPTGATEWKVEAQARYSIFVHEGTKAHDIKPKGPGYPLRFFWPKVGKWVAFMSVRHPGTAAQPFLTDPLTKMMRRYTKH